MGTRKVHVFIVKPTIFNGDADIGAPGRLIRGTLKDVEAKLREEVTIEVCDAATAHQMRDVEIEEAVEQ